MSQSVHLCGLVPKQAEVLERRPAISLSAAAISGRLVTCVCVEMVPQQSDCSESPSTQVTFMGPLICVALHVPVQVGSPRASVATELTLESLLYTFGCRMQSIY